jgi:hypothetical protein
VDCQIDLVAVAQVVYVHLLLDLANRAYLLQLPLPSSFHPLEQAQIAVELETGLVHT